MAMVKNLFEMITPFVKESVGENQPSGRLEEKPVPQSQRPLDVQSSVEAGEQIQRKQEEAEKQAGQA